MASPRRRGYISAVVAVSLVVVATYSIGAGGGAGRVSSGNSLSEPGRNLSTLVEMPPGTQMAMMMTRFLNNSQEPLTLRGIEPLGSEDFEDVVRVVKARVGRRDPAAGDAVVTLGFYGTDPPVEFHDGACLVQDLDVLEGAEIEPIREPDYASMLVVYLELVGEGKAKIEGVRVTYEQGGRLFEQSLMTGVRVKVSEDVPPPPLPLDEASCIHLARLLPGNRVRED
jgi:hypothetical protein